MSMWLVVGVVNWPSQDLDVSVNSYDKIHGKLKQPIFNFDFTMPFRLLAF